MTDTHLLSAPPESLTRPSLRLERSDARSGVLVATCVALLAWADYATGTELRIYPLYFVPLAFAAARMTFAGAVGSAVLAAGLWTAANWFAGMAYESAWIWVGNVASQLTAFLTIVVLVHRLRHRGDAEHRLARTDPLTGLANARAFYEAAAAELEQHRRYQHVISVAYLDLDGFKHVNDRLGHLGADRLLQTVAALLQRGTRASDIVARLGGDEFCILYPEMGARDLERALVRLQSTVREGLNEEEIPVSFSIGAVTFTQAPKTVETLLAAADELMYEVKASGKDAIRTKIAGPGAAGSSASRVAER